MTTFPRTPLTVPPLENGDALSEPLRECLSRAEFERRYAAMPHVKKAELIEGVVHMAAALRFGSHAEPHSFLKKAVYRRNDIREYVVWQVFDRKIDWFYLDAGRYVDLEPGEDGLCRSRVFRGLWLDREAMVQGNRAQVLAVLNQGLQSTERQTFVETLQSIQDA